MTTRVLSARVSSRSMGCGVSTTGFDRLGPLLIEELGAVPK